MRRTFQVFTILFFSLIAWSFCVAPAMKPIGKELVLNFDLRANFVSGGQCPPAQYEAKGLQVFTRPRYENVLLSWSPADQALKLCGERLDVQDGFVVIGYALHLSGIDFARAKVMNISGCKTTAPSKCDLSAISVQIFFERNIMKTIFSFIVGILLVCVGWGMAITMPRRS